METKKAAGIGLIVAAGGLAAYGISKGKAPVIPYPECDVDADCPEGYVCEGGLCIKAPEPELATLWGLVTNANSKQPISGIVIAANGQTRTSDANGRYEFPDLEPGTYCIELSDPADRYEMPSAITVTLGAGAILQRNIELLLPAEYDITLGDLDISSPIIAGYPVMISCYAKLCMGPVGVPKTRQVILYVNGSAIASVNVTLTKTFLCAEQKLEFEYTPSSPGTYSIELGELSGSFEAVEAVFQNTGLELVRSARDSIPADATGTTKGFLECDAWLDDFYFTFNPTIEQIEPYKPEHEWVCEKGFKWNRTTGMCVPVSKIPNAHFEGQIRYDYNGQTNYEYSNGDKTARALHGGGGVAVQFGVISAAKYDEWLNSDSPLSDYGWPAIHHIKTAHAFSYSAGGDWAAPSVKSGSYDFSENGVLTLAPGKWIVLAAPSLSICYSRRVSTRGGYSNRMRCNSMRYYKVYKAGMISV